MSDQDKRDLIQGLKDSDQDDRGVGYGQNVPVPSVQDMEHIVHILTEYFVKNPDLVRDTADWVEGYANKNGF